MLKNPLISKHDAPILYNDHLATIKVIDNELVAIIFDNKDIQGLALPVEDFIAQQGTISTFVQNKKPTHWDVQYTPETLIEAKKIRNYINELDKLTGGLGSGVGGIKVRQFAIASAVKKYGYDNPPSPSTLGLWKKLNNELVSGAIGKIASKTRQSYPSKFSDAVMLLVCEAIDEWIFNSSVTSLQIPYNAFKEKADKQGFLDHEVPCRETFRKYFKALPPELLLQARLSKKEYKKHMRNASKKIYTERPLERVEADGVFLEIGLKDETDKYLGPVTLIFLIDVHTRCILGYSMNIGRGESSSSVIHAIRHALCRKPAGSFHTQNDNSWFCYGVIERLVVDGGSAFGSIQTQSFVANANGSTVIETLESYAPWLKPFIERFNKTLRVKCASLLPGYVGRLSNQKILEHSIKAQATLTIYEFKQFVEMWIVDDYHHTPHSGLNGSTPCEAWHESYQNGWFPESPVAENAIKLPAGESQQATIMGGESCHAGIQIKNIVYNDSKGRLKRIGMQLKQRGHEAKVDCLYSDIDISSVTVTDPFTQEKFEVSTTDERIQQGMTRVEYLAYKKPMYANKGATQGNSLLLNPDLQAKRDELKAHKSKLENTKKVRQRRAIPEDYENEIKNQDANPLDDYLSSPLINEINRPLVDEDDDEDDEIFEMD